MNIDVSKIVQDRIDALAEEKKIESKIEETFEQTILKAVESALDSYKLRCTIEEKVTEQVSKVVADLDFQSYNSFMVEKMSQIINETCREDICQKAEKKFRELFLCQTKEIKLSSIFEKYREMVCEKVEESEQYSRREWHCKCQEDGRYGWIDCELDENDGSGSYRYRSDSEISFTVHRDYNDKTKGKILSLYLKGNDIKENFKFGALNDVELMLVQAVFNEIPIIIDVESEDDIDSSYDCDY